MGKAGKLLTLLSEGQSLNTVRQPFWSVSEHKALRQSLDSDGAPPLWDSALNTVLSVLKPKQGPAASTHNHL